ncbi:hypothetical protein [Deinococcus arenicola]|uniref:Uridine kinase n=1 Tax=Deinococcus arenicola TaxID=2994950 RepID=A0ABU4DTR3_9DEIO|nr:hypothetical protein [Deinococcus sp. ZS9-10]MDV6375813.1 hypothetical protein [Deinococcus sp. ZS9-10]
MLLDGLAVRLAAQSAHPVLRVAVDGPDGAGKTTFADELAAVLGERGREVIRASVDSFHQPHAVRYHLDRDLPEGFYRGSYEYAGLRRALLDFGAAAIGPPRMLPASPISMAGTWRKRWLGLLFLLNEIFLLDEMQRSLACSRPFAVRAVLPSKAALSNAPKLSPLHAAV